MSHGVAKDSETS